ncbi:MAG: TIGR02453 family protein [Arsenicicoccus sp.]|nr:MAG: TIGR02453 family protein [Arsenicicoccus sp.]
MGTFAGIPHAATDFYARLEQDNSRDFWAAHKADYEEHVRAPLEALTAELAEEFGEAKLFRPHRDVRFSADKSPYKTHQGAYVAVAEATGWYVQVSADGLMLGGGCYQMDSARLKAYRAAVDSPGTGQQLRQIVEDLRGEGWEIGGEQVKTAPRGWDREHERIELLRHKALTGMRWVEDGDIVTTPRLVEEVRQRWSRVHPLVDWLARTDPAARH